MDAPPPEPASEAATGKPGKVRTWWHPLLAGFLRWQLGSHYQIQEEVPVGQKPLQIDVLLLRKEQGELPEEARRVLAGLAEYLNEFTLLELKSPSDTLRAGDFQTFLAYAMLYRAQNEPLLAPNRLNLLVLATHLTRPYREELRLLGVTARQEKPGVWALEGGVVSHRTWLLETAVLAGVQHPLLTLFSPQFLSQGPQTYAQLRQGGYTELVVYLAQQIQQFQQKGAEFAMQHLGTEDEMEQALRNLVASLPLEQRVTDQDLYNLVASLPLEQRVTDQDLYNLVASLPLEQRVTDQDLCELVASLPPETRLAGLSPKERVAGLSPKELLASLSPEAKEALRKQMQGDDPPAPAE